MLLKLFLVRLLKKLKNKIKKPKIKSFNNNQL